MKKPPHEETQASHSLFTEETSKERMWSLSFFIFFSKKAKKPSQSQAQVNKFVMKLRLRLLPYDTSFLDLPTLRLKNKKLFYLRSIVTTTWKYSGAFTTEAQTSPL